jgi:SAM-dependent methyltransferase
LSFSKQQFIGFWGASGYLSDRNAGHELLTSCIQPHAAKEKTCLEIGSGGGFWLGYLQANFGRVIAIDVIPRPPTLLVDEYHELADSDYHCSPIADAAIDFVWCFDVFCHLPNSAVREYVASVARVLKPDGVAVLAFANWDNHPLLASVSEAQNYSEQPHKDGWFYMNKPLALDIVTEAGLVCQDLLPNFRDAILCCRKEVLDA